MSHEPNEHSATAGPPPSQPNRVEEPPPAPGSASASVPVHAHRNYAWALVAFPVLLIVVLAGVLLSPYWAPVLMPLLPWTEKPSDRYNALAARVAALAERPVAPPVDVDAIKSTQSALAQRITAVGDAVSALRQTEQAATKAALALQAQRLDAVAAQSTAEIAGITAAIDKVRQDQAQHEVSSGEVAKRVDALERQVQARDFADRSGAVSVLALLQMREALETARPFPEEYAAFKEFTAHDPKLAAAAAPLAAAARDGVASRSVLRQRLSDLADQIATAKPPVAKPKWWARALDQLSGLVTIRRIDATGKTGPWAVIDVAQRELAQGDLAGAVAALEKLSGASAEAAQPWLQMARARLAAENALNQLQVLLTARLARPPAGPTGPPTAAPGQPPTPPKAPS